MNNITTERLEGRVVLHIHGDFTFDINRAFRDAYQAHPSTSHYEVDLRTAQYLDSSGLGMLLQLREYAGGDSARVTISGATPTIRSILEIAKFSRLFDLR